MFQVVDVPEKKYCVNLGVIENSPHEKFVWIQNWLIYIESVVSDAVSNLIEILRCITKHYYA